MVDEAPVLELRGITKRFPGVVANDEVDFDLRRGEVHALLGENGAGKSTLMNVLYGLYQPDEGEIRVNGRPVPIHSPKDAIDLGIGMVHQHFMLIPVMTVAENIVLGTEPTRGGVFLDYDAAVERGKRIETLSRAGATTEQLARLMVGREVLLRVEKSAAQPGEPLLQVDGVSVKDDRALEAVHDVSFEVRAGEVVGIAGVDGNGQS